MSDKDIKKKQRKRQQVAPENITEESELDSNRDGHALEHIPSAASVKFETAAKVVNAFASQPGIDMMAVAHAKSAASQWMGYATQRRLRRKGGSLTQQGDFGVQSLNGIDIHSEGRSSGTAGLLGGEDDDQPKMSGIGLDEVHDDYITPQIVRKRSSSSLNVSIIIYANRTLLEYFTKMANAVHEEATIDLSFVESLLQNGADINATDKHGQTVMHEAARAWHVDVARWLLERKCNPNAADNYGRTPLHVAAAVDCPEMVNLLIEWGALKEAETKGEQQTPVFYAAKSDATNSLKALIKKNCKFKLIRDYKGRTPIHVAAELDRSETARLLLELNAPVGVCDNQGQKAITWMITKMAPVAHEALNQFRSIDRHNRKQYFYLNLLVQDSKLDPESRSQTPLQVTVSFKQYDLLITNTMRRLQHVMWIKFARFWAIWNLGINFLYIILWTLIGILVEYDVRHKYSFPDDWYRLMLWIIAVTLTAWQITEEIKEFFRSKRNHKKWEDWRHHSIKKDMEFCHPRFPEEKDYLNTELTALEDLSPKYFKDMWNIFDWACYILLFVDIFTHVADVISHSEALARAHIRVMAVTIILLWLRLMKNARAFTLLGPFIVMLGHMLKDCARFLFLYMEFYIPFMAVFWMIYGGTKKSQDDPSEEVIVNGYQFPAQLIFSLLRLTLVDEYDYDNMKKIDEAFTDIILIAWFLLSSILCLNLFIALLSDTFQRVYDNAQANSVMQKAITILNIWEGISAKRKKKFFEYIESNCSPLMEYYDDDLTQSEGEDLKKVTFQIKDTLDEFTEQFKLHFGETSANMLLHLDTEQLGELGKSTNSHFGGGGGGPGGGGGKPGGGGGGGRSGTRFMVTSQQFEEEVAVLQQGLHELNLRQTEFMNTYKRDMNEIQVLLREMTASSAAAATVVKESASRAGTVPSQEDGFPALDSQRTSSTDKVSKMRKKKKRQTNPADMVLSVEMLEPSTDFSAVQMHSPHLAGSVLLDAFTTPVSVPNLVHLTELRELQSELPGASSELQQAVEESETHS